MPRSRPNRFRTNAPWKQNEISALTKQLARGVLPSQCQIASRTTASVQHKAEDILAEMNRPKRAPRPKWSEAEIEQLIAAWDNGDSMINVMPGRPQMAIYGMISRLKIEGRIKPRMPSQVDKPTTELYDAGSALLAAAMLDMRFEDDEEAVSYQTTGPRPRRPITHIESQSAMAQF